MPKNTHGFTQKDVLRMKRETERGSTEADMENIDSAMMDADSQSNGQPSPESKKAAKPEVQSEL